jgi:hypothetical protein
MHFATFSSGIRESGRVAGKGLLRDCYFTFFAGDRSGDFDVGTGFANERRGQDEFFAFYFFYWRLEFKLRFFSGLIDASLPSTLHSLYMGVSGMKGSWPSAPVNVSCTCLQLMMASPAENVLFSAVAVIGVLYA